MFQRQKIGLYTMILVIAMLDATVARIGSHLDPHGLTVNEVAPESTPAQGPSAALGTDEQRA